MLDQEIKDWSLKKNQLMTEYPQLTEADLLYEIGKEEDLLKRLQQKLNKNEKEIRKWLSMMG